MVIPFANTVGIQNDTLINHQTVQNHLGSIHAGAQFTFAESMSGNYLQVRFAHLKESVIPLLRESVVKYKKEARSTLRAEITVDEEALKRFEMQFLSKGRSTITLFVTLRDEEDDITCEGSFKWFIQHSDQPKG